MNYLDTSALIKRFVTEKGSSLVQDLIGLGEPIATATIAYAEVYSALTRKRREGAVRESRYASLCRRFEEDWQGTVRVELTSDVLVLSRDLIKRRVLRGFDAIHLASALTLREALGTPITFAAADRRLLAAAAGEGLRSLNVEESGGRGA